MGHSFVDVMGSLDPRLHAFEAPYLFRGYRHMEGVIEGPIGQELLDGLKSQHIKGLSFTYSGGASGVAALDREIRRPEDLRGLKVGVFGDAVDGAWLTSLGATPVPLGHRLESILPSADGGELNAVVTTWRNFEKTSLEQKFKYVSLMDSTYLVSVTYVNEAFFNALPKDYQAMLVEESRKAGRIERAKTIELNARAKREMLVKGVRSVSLSADARRRFNEALRPANEAIERILGKDLVEGIKNTADAPNPKIPAELAGR
jgi:TRAP-type C4-dicarboxylate transport system substrate-binding protein